MALTLVFGAVVAVGAAAGAWGAAKPSRAAASDVSGFSPAQARSWVETSGDRWAAYYSPQQYATLQQALSGEYVGVGLWVERAAGGAIAVSRVQSGAPAAQAGIRPGDRLLRVDGRAVSGLPVTEVVSLLRGLPASSDGIAAQAATAPGSTVTLALAQPATPDAIRQVTVRRRVLAADDVTVDHPGTGVTRIAVEAFSAGTGEEIQAAVHQAETDAPGGGILLDLRGCAGGLVAEAVEAASAFLDGGPVGTLTTTDGAFSHLTAASGGDTGTPLVVLVDGGTMSAGELLAGALQDRGRAVLVGSTTFGKGSVQEPSTLADGSVVERTVGHYTTPSGRSPEDVGIQPDVAVPLADSAAVVQSTALTVLDGLDAARAASQAVQVRQ